MKIKKETKTTYRIEIKSHALSNSVIEKIAEMECNVNLYAITIEYSCRTLSIQCDVLSKKEIDMIAKNIQSEVKRLGLLRWDLEKLGFKESV